MTATSDASNSPGIHVTVDIGRCRGYASCVFLSPDVFELDDNAKARVLIAEPDDELVEQVRQAAAECPTLAIDIET